LLVKKGSFGVSDNQLKLFVVLWVMGLPVVLDCFRALFGPLALRATLNYHLYCVGFPGGREG
jgi:hypothetical protein